MCGILHEGDYIGNIAPTESSCMAVAVACLGVQLRPKGFMKVCLPFARCQVTRHRRRHHRARPAVCQPTRWKQLGGAASGAAAHAERHEDAGGCGGSQVSVSLKRPASSAAGTRRSPLLFRWHIRVATVPGLLTSHKPSAPLPATSAGRCGARVCGRLHTTAVPAGGHGQGRRAVV